jgi:hypothetical protein
MFSFLYEDGCRSGHPYPEQRAGPYVKALTRVTGVRVPNTVIAVRFALTRESQSLPLDRLTMHLLENFFELVKIVLHDCNRFPDV